MSTHSHTFAVVGTNIRIDCDSASLHDIFVKNFACTTPVGRMFALQYLVKSVDIENRFEVSRPGSNFHLSAKDIGQLIHFLEGDLVVQLQLLRSDLLFLHSAVVSDGKEAHLFTGPSGAGKSTLCWGLLHHDFQYLSDELAPIFPEQASVSPYSHALCLKSVPPAAYPTPDEAIVTHRGIHIPLPAMPTPPLVCDQPIGSIFFVEYQPRNEKASIEQLGHAEAATRLYPNILNALAHSNDGLDAALQLTRDVECYRVDAADLADTCDLIGSVVANHSSTGWR
jgi:hypothetical protein